MKVLTAVAVLSPFCLCADIVEDALSRKLANYAEFGMGEHMQELIVNRVAEMDGAAVR